MIKGSYFKFLPYAGDPTYFIPAALSQHDKIQHIKERGGQIHLAIMHWSGKLYISLKIFIRELHKICHPRLLTLLQY
jgi:hypothetical protein